MKRNLTITPTQAMLLKHAIGGMREQLVARLASGRLTEEQRGFTKTAMSDSLDLLNQLGVMEHDQKLNG
jgi:hypothetical protein